MIFSPDINLVLWSEFAQSNPVPVEPSLLDRISRFFEGISVKLGFSTRHKVSNERLFSRWAERVKKMGPLEILGHFDPKAIYGLARQAVAEHSLERRMAPVLKTDLSQLSSGSKLIEELLRSSEGFCIGEHHDEAAAKLFLQNHFSELKKWGVQSIFVEGAFLGAESIIEDFNAGKTDDVSWVFVNDLETVLKAREWGIKVYPIDCFRLDSPDEARLLNLNFATLLKVEEIRKKVPDLGKYIVWVGARHASTVHEKGKWIPGISELLNIPAIVIRDTPPKKEESANSAVQRRDRARAAIQVTTQAIGAVVPNVIVYY